MKKSRNNSYRNNDYIANNRRRVVRALRQFDTIFGLMEPKPELNVPAQPNIIDAEYEEIK